MSYKQQLGRKPKTTHTWTFSNMNISNVSLCSNTFLGCGHWHPRLFDHSATPLFRWLYFICITQSCCPSVVNFGKLTSHALESPISPLWKTRHEISLSSDAVAVKCSSFALTESAHTIHIAWLLVYFLTLALCILWEVTLSLEGRIHSSWFWQFKHLH